MLWLAIIIVVVVMLYSLVFLSRKNVKKKKNWAEYYTKLLVSIWVFFFFPASRNVAWWWWQWRTWFLSSRAIHSSEFRIAVWICRHAGDCPLWRQNCVWPPVLIIPSSHCWLRECYHAALHLFLVLYAHCSKKSQWLALLKVPWIWAKPQDWCSVLFSLCEGVF